MRVALLTDTHSGARNDSPVVADYFGRFYDEVFFPKIDELGIRQIVHLGDMVDRRRYLNYGTLSAFRRQFINPCVARQLSVDWIIGNHDTSLKNTNRLNAAEAIQFRGLTVFTGPQTVMLGGRPVLYLPWICDETEQTSLHAIQTTTATLCFGHLELAGFTMHKGQPPSADGLTADVFGAFDFVGTGHYHHKSSQGNVHYLGAPYEMTWADYNDPRGFHIFDTDTNELEFVQNPFRLFYRLVYDDRNNDFSYISTFLNALRPADSLYRNAFVKLIVKHKHNPVWYDMVADALYKVGAHDIVVVDEFLTETVVQAAAEENGQTNDAYTPPPDDTLSLIHDYVEETFPDAQESADAVRALLHSLYTEAMAELTNA